MLERLFAALCATQVHEDIFPAGKDLRRINIANGAVPPLDMIHPASRSSSRELSVFA
jgi:hypothetical protein